MLPGGPSPSTAEAAVARDLDAEHGYSFADELVAGQLLLWAWCFAPSSAAFTLGQLAETLGDHDRARVHYTEALPLHGEGGAG